MKLEISTLLPFILSTVISQISEPTPLAKSPLVAPHHVESMDKPDWSPHLRPPFNAPDVPGPGENPLLTFRQATERIDFLPDETSWQQFTKSSKLSMIFYGAIWCRHCKRLTPHWYSTYFKSYLIILLFIF
jgi:thiol-disulfide isomerase/thioredoxin